MNKVKVAERRPESRGGRRQGRLTDPVVATAMYEALATIVNLNDTEQILATASEVLNFVRDKEATEMPKKTEVVPVSAELVCEPTPTRYTVRLGVKLPSQVEQYRNMEANVAVTSNNPDEAMEEARQQFVKAVVTVCITMGETPPDEIRPSVEEIYQGDTPAIYGEGD